MANLVVSLIAISAVVRAVLVLYRERKRGRGCFGCSDSGICNGDCRKADKDKL